MPATAVPRYPAAIGRAVIPHDCSSAPDSPPESINDYAKVEQMTNPVLLFVEDNPDILRILGQDLRARYGTRFEVRGAESGAQARAMLDDCRTRDDAVTLLLVERRMTAPSGAEFLAQTSQLFPHAMRLLFTATQPEPGLVQVSDLARVNYGLVHPAGSFEEVLYPVIDQLITDWQGPDRIPILGIRVVGHRWAPASHDVRDFLSRNEIAYEWLDLDSDPRAAQVLATVAGGQPRLPLVQFPDGSYLEAPSAIDLAAKIGLQTRASQPSYDLIIVGGGPAGLAAGVYGASEGLRTLLIDAVAPGGQASMSSHIDNYLGFPEGIRGADLAQRAVAQAERFGAEIVTPQTVTRIRIHGTQRIVALADGTERRCRALLLALGVDWRKLDVPGIAHLTGAGVYYAGTLAEVRSCMSEDIYIVGGANSAGQAAVHFAHYARTVTLLVRGAALSATMSQYLEDQIATTPNIHVRLNTQVTAVHGTTRLEAITLADARTGTVETLPAPALFIFIGAAPHTDWLDGVVQCDAQGYILTGRDLLQNGMRPPGWPLPRDPYLLETSVPGIFAAGDVRHGAVKRVAAAVGAGSMAVQFIHQYLGTL
jgi:thioredoxin reductase (NADPH)